MEDNDDLEKYYLGDKYWNNFVNAFEEVSEESESFQKLKKKLNGKTDLARVIYGLLDSSSFNWLESEIPVLGNLKPIDCIGQDKLELRLKTVLMRMPC